MTTLARAFAPGALALSLAGAPPLAAQSDAAVDSAQAARTAWRAAAAALEARDTAAARAHLQRASESWPEQGAYVLALARLSAAMRDTAGTAAALRRFADVGLGVELGADSAIGALRSAPVVARELARIAAQTAPLARGAVAFTLADTAFFPEGIAHDARTGSTYLSSVRRRRIAERRRDGGVRVLVPTGAGGLDAALGVAVDSAAALLWVTSGPLPQMEGRGTGRPALLAFDLASGAPLGRWEPPGGDGGVEHQLGDLAVGPRGDVWVSDTRAAAVYRLRRGAGERIPAARSLEVAASGPLLRSPQGIAPTPDGRALLVADYSHGILRVSTDDGRIARLAGPRTGSTLGIDGICLRGDTLYGVQNGTSMPRVVAMELDAARERIVRMVVLDRQPALAPEPTTCAIVGDELHYVANSQWEQYGDDGRPRAGARLRAPLVIRVPLTGPGGG